MQVHPQFKLNGISLTRDGANKAARSWIKKGQGFEMDMGEFLLDWLSPSNTVQVKTSGSTGTPKTLHLQKESMVHSAKATAEYFQLKPKDTALLCLSAKHIAGKMMLVRAMVMGMWISVVEPSSDPLKNDGVKYDFAAMVPIQAQNSLSRLGQVNKLIIGGAPISQTLRQNLSKQPNSIFETFGMTETITHIAVKDITGGNDHFRTLPNITIGKDKRGCLLIDAPKISKNSIITNDLVEIKDKNSFKWLGRHDSIINSGGVKLIPEQIEEKLSQIIPNRFFVAGRPNEELGEELIVLVEGDINLEETKLQIMQLKGLSKYERPKYVFSIHGFVESKSGKINRDKTLALFKK